MFSKSKLREVELQCKFRYLGRIGVICKGGISSEEKEFNPISCSISKWSSSRFLGNVLIDLLFLSVLSLLVSSSSWNTNSLATNRPIHLVPSTDPQTEGKGGQNHYVTFRISVQSDRFYGDDGFPNHNTYVRHRVRYLSGVSLVAG